MYTVFNVSLAESFASDYNKEGTRIYQTVTENTAKKLNKIINENNIDGNKLQELWFPDKIYQGKPFIFISHSHKNENTAIRLAGYLLKEFGILSFVDSCVWENMDDLIEILDDLVDDHDLNSSYVHLMLASALMEMIDNCECMFFLNTRSSVKENGKTESPWLYFELNTVNVIRKKSGIVLPHAEDGYYTESMEFTPKMNQMKKIDENILRKWKNKCDENSDPFETLYKICGVPEFS